MLENIIVGVVIGGFLIFSVWGLRVAADQARRDVEAHRAARDSARKGPAKAAVKSK